MGTRLRFTVRAANEYRAGACRDETRPITVHLLLCCERHAMLQLRCTQKARSILGVSDASLCEIELGKPSLGGWYVNVFPVERRKALIFVSERTLLSFVIYGARKGNTREPLQLFRHGLENVLRLLAVPGELVVKALSEYEELEFTKTVSKRVLGNVNDLVFHYDHGIWHDGGLRHCNLSVIHSHVNQMPQRNLGWKHSRDATIEQLAYAHAT